MNIVKSTILSLILIAGAFALSLVSSPFSSAQTPPEANTALTPEEMLMCEETASTIAELQEIRQRVIDAQDIDEVQLAVNDFNSLETHNGIDINEAQTANDFDRRKEYLISKIDETIAEDTSGKYTAELEELRAQAENAPDYTELSFVAQDLDEIRSKMGLNGTSGGGGTVGGGGGEWAGGVLDGSGKNNRAPVSSFNNVIVLNPGDNIQAAINSAGPGTDIQLKSGVYNFSNISISGKGGNPNAWIRLGNAPGEHPILKPTGGWATVNVSGGSSYILIEGLEVDGNRVGTTLPDGTYIGSWNDMLNYSNRSCGNIGYHCNQGIMVGCGNCQTNQAHHIVIRDNVTHDFGGSGISTFGADYVIIEDNVSFNNGNFSRYGESGISAGFPALANGGSLDEYGFIVRRNITYDNKQYLGSIDCGCGPGITDGNGIIIDGMDHHGQYRRVLVESNLSYNNGVEVAGQGVHGSGMHAVDSSNVDFINNTAYGNAAGQIFTCCASNNNKFYNNIAVGNRPLFAAHGVPFTGGCNISSASDNIPTTVADPLFNNPGGGDFSLRSGSPAINASCGQTALSDLNGRTANGAKDIGAIES